MLIVLISESLMLCTTVVDGSILRDRALREVRVRMSPRKRMFKVATSVAGKQLRIIRGHWSLMTVEEARGSAKEGANGNDQMP